MLEKYFKEKNPIITISLKHKTAAYAVRIMYKISLGGGLVTEEIFISTVLQEFNQIKMIGL